MTGNSETGTTKPLTKDEIILLDIISNFPSKNLKITPIEPHKYILEFTPQNSDIAIRFKFNKDITRLSVDLVGIPIKIHLPIRQNTELQKAIILAVNQRNTALTPTDRKVLTHNNVVLRNVNDSLNKYFKQQECSALKELIFPNTKKSQIEYHKSTSFKKLNKMGITEMTLIGRHFICDFKNKTWTEDKAK